jgi:hypothetical protein
MSGRPGRTVSNWRREHTAQNGEKQDENELPVRNSHCLPLSTIVESSRP